MRLTNEVESYGVPASTREPGRRRKIAQHGPIQHRKRSLEDEA
jgi:hypothetical protein